jgi:hypothetical protein
MKSMPPQFIERLSERWLFERAVAHLYELVLPRLSREPRLGELADKLVGFLDEERLHMQMCEALLRQLGREPRQQAAPPALNIAASEAASLLELARGHEMSASDLVRILHAAELIDHAGWSMLIELGRDAHLDEEWLRSFRAADREEREHLHVIEAHRLRLEREELHAPS